MMPCDAERLVRYRQGVKYGRPSTRASGSVEGMKSSQTALMPSASPPMAREKRTDCLLKYRSRVSGHIASSRRIAVRSTNSNTQQGHRTLPVWCNTHFCSQATSSSSCRSDLVQLAKLADGRPVILPCPYLMSRFSPPFPLPLPFYSLNGTRNGVKNEQTTKASKAWCRLSSENKSVGPGKLEIRAPQNANRTRTSRMHRT